MADNPYAKAKKEEKWHPRIFRDDAYLRDADDIMVWLGHASFFFRLNGMNLLIDPVFGNLSPLMSRYTDFPLLPEKLSNIDLLMITHDHRDHCDKPSIKAISKNNRKTQVLTGLNMASLLSSWTNGHRISEMGWYQQSEFRGSEIRVTFLPTRHWSRRWLTDTNKRLWGAFLLETKELTIYFGGDSGYGPHFKDTAMYFPNIDYAFLGIGAFAPEWFMGSNHMSPADALKAFHDLGARKLVPMHYGTFDLSDEPLGEPIRLLSEIAIEKNLDSKIIAPAIGEAVSLHKNNHHL